jgi:hypothetical protein
MAESLSTAPSVLTERPLALVGLGIDVSASMQSSIEVGDIGEVSRLESLRLAIRRAAERVSLRVQSSRATKVPGSSESLVFAYVFGMRQGRGIQDLLSLISLLGTASSLADIVKEVISAERLGQLKVRYVNKMRNQNWANWASGQAYDFMHWLGLGSEHSFIKKRMDTAAKQIREEIVRDLKKEVRQQLPQPFYRRLINESIQRVADPVEQAIKSEQWDRVESIIESEISVLVAQVESTIATESFLTEMQDDVTLTVTELARLWEMSNGIFEQAERYMFGSTPMCECLHLISQRFESEKNRMQLDARRFLLLVSDGEPSDGDPLPLLEQLHQSGVIIASCFVTNTNVTEPRRLYSTSRTDWPAAAKLMFNAASVLTDEDLYREYLERAGWVIEDGARLFVQVNHTETIEDFLTLTLGQGQVAASEGVPLRSDSAKSGFVQSPKAKLEAS